MNKLMTQQNQTIVEELKGTLDEIITQLKKLIREGNARRLVIKNKNGKILFQSQLTIGVAGTAFFTAIAPIISAVSMFVLFMNDVTVLVEREPDDDEAENGYEDEYEVKADIIEIEEEEEEDKGSPDDQRNQTEHNKQDGEKHNGHHDDSNEENGEKP